MKNGAGNEARMYPAALAGRPGTRAAAALSDPASTLRHPRSGIHAA
jgi:hypothetical protein